MALILDLGVEIDVLPNGEEEKPDGTGVPATTWHLSGWVDRDCHLMVRLRH